MFELKHTGSWTDEHGEILEGFEVKLEGQTFPEYLFSLAKDGRVCRINKNFDNLMWTAKETAANLIEDAKALLQ